LIETKREILIRITSGFHVDAQEAAAA